MKAIIVSGDGHNPSDLILEDVPRPECPDGSVLIRTSFAGVNRPDILQRRGLYPPPADASPLLGLEVSGVIETAGGQWRRGTKVCALTHGGGYAEYVSVDARHVLPLPKGVGLEDAAALPEAVLTVYANLVELGALKAGETVLVHGANSGIGSMTIQMARALGARVIATARGADKCAYAEKLGADVVIDATATDFSGVVRDAGGADVVLDIVGGDYTPRNLDALNTGGRLVQVGFGRTSRVEIDLRTVMRKQALITGSMLRPRSAEEKARLIAAVRARIWPLIGSGKINLPVERVFAARDAAAAHAWLEGGTHKGKVVLSWA